MPQRHKRTNNTYVIGVPELQGEKKNTWAKQLSKETTAQNFVNMVKDTNLQTQEVQQFPCMKSTQKTILSVKIIMRKYSNRDIKNYMVYIGNKI